MIGREIKQQFNGLRMALWFASFDIAKFQNFTN
jgi:hypothetical protein